MGWEIVVGIESHAQLRTQSKMFSGASTNFGAPPNTQACAVDIALPGTLPVPNRAAVEHAIRFGLSVGGKINRRSIFARKNYFYPDLPKGYQISQYELPIVQGGEVRILLNQGEKRVALTRAHLEEDAGKSLHEDFHGMTGIDLNRAGIPLLEIVSEPVMIGAHEAVAYARALHNHVVWIGICDGNMEEGSFRCDANVSVRRQGDTKLGTRCEIKNLNSFRFMEQAIEFEAGRQIELLETGGTVRQETRLFDPDRGETRSMRSKEDAPDYRYFPDPDLLPLVVTEEDIKRIKDSIPERPESKRQRYVEQWKIPLPTAELLTTSRDRAEYFESSLSAVDQAKQSAISLSAANVVISVLPSYLNEAGLTYRQSPFTSGELGRIQELVFDGIVSGTASKEIIKARFAGEKGSVDDLIDKHGLKQISDSREIERLVEEILETNKKQVEDYRAGKEKALNSLVGQVMKASKGRANPAQVNEILRRKLSR